jgi:CHAT domain-containing protein
MNTFDLVEMLSTLPSLTAQRQFLEEHVASLDDQVARLLKEKADHFLRVDIHQSLNMASLLDCMSRLTQNSLYKALGMLAEANARSIGLGEYERAVKLYDQAAEIYRLNGRIAEQARSQVGKVNALSYLSRFRDALDAGEWASPILEAHEQWLPLVTLTMNLGVVFARQGKDPESLVMFDRAAELYQKMDVEGKTSWALIQQNRAVALRDLGRFDDSIAASRLTMEVLKELGETVEAARAEQSMAFTYFVLGRFNEALETLDRVRSVFLDDGRLNDAMRTELDISYCLLQLRRFSQVIEKCQYIRSLFAETGMHQIRALALINEGIAYAQSYQYDKALASLSEARQVFAETGNEFRVASTDLERSTVLLYQGQYAEGLALAVECASVFNAHHMLIEEARALIVAGRAALALKKHQQADEFLVKALQAGNTLNIPTVKHQGHALLGTLAQDQGDLEAAQTHFDLAIQEVEQLRGRLMIEFRVNFLEDKEALYQNMVDVCIEQGQLLKGLEFAERAKSRTLLDLLAYRLDLTVQTRNEDDLPLVEELTRLRTERDQLYRLWEGEAENTEQIERDWSSQQSLHQKAQQRVLGLEKQITDLWHRLLIRNADYARDAALWTVRTESVQPYLEQDTLLVEYYVVHNQFVAFLVATDNIQVIRLDANLGRIQTLLQLFQLNMRAVPRYSRQQVETLTRNAQKLLSELYDLAFFPLEQYLAPYSKLIIVPHGPLHYLPFQALYDGTSYLIERYQLSYLPNASSLRYCQEERPPASNNIFMGYSNKGQLPYAVEEVSQIAALFEEKTTDEARATLAEFYRIAPECRTIHLATHGDFRADNPLFSGLILADGSLTTMDIFNLRLKASLVTLSACQTGRSVVGGGDELLGLMRAFLSAGAASVALTLWAVEDRSTALLMKSFYHNMVEGYGKGQALRMAQLQILQQESEISGKPAHPYRWAPFILVGAPGPL